MVKALILVGGFGTRLRPLTLSKPKPLVDFAGKPVVVHQLEALQRAGCSEVVLAINYQPELMLGFVQEWGPKLGLKITISRETTPMGTAGPLALARDILKDGSGDPFFVLNSDVVSEYPFEDLLAFHRDRGAEATILVTKVEDPSKYGVVLMDERGEVDKFVEKPKVFVGDKINAGMYIISPAVLDRIELRPTSIEKEVFPAVAADKGLYAMTLPGFWMDIGQPKDYLTGVQLYLAAKRANDPAALASGEGIVGNVLIDPTATVGKGCKIGPNVCIAAGCTIGDGARISDTNIFGGVEVKAHALVKGSILGWGSTVGAWGRVEGMSILGEDVAVQDELLLNGAVVLPHKEIKASVPEPRIIL